MNKISVLIADDDCEHRRLLSRALCRGREDIEVFATGSREELIELARERSFDCAVLDYNIPPFTAPALVAALRAVLPEIPIIVVSASEEQRVAIECFRTSGVIDFLPKWNAVSEGALLEKVRAAIADAAQRRTKRTQIDRRIEAMRRFADTDCLTGLLNRRHFQRWARSPRTSGDRRATCACVMIDLDFFKRINDRYGHDAGDTALRRTAALMRSVARPEDVLIRWGGEEFLAVLPSVSPVEAWAWAERLRAAMSATRCSTASGEFRVTASIGVHVGPTGDAGERGPVEADKALYLAKELGRDRVCTSEMVRAIDAASHLQCEPDLGLDDRFGRWLSEMAETMGPVQLEHVDQHGVAVSGFAMRLADSLDVSQDDLLDLRAASRLHDIGKAGVPEAILAKPGPLSPDERSLVDQHARFGADVARALGAPERVCAVIAAHHDRFDRPEGAGGDLAHDSARLARTLGVADAVVTMRADRPYAERKTAEQTLAEIRLERGRQFDPDIVDAITEIGVAAIAAA